MVSTLGKVGWRGEGEQGSREGKKKREGDGMTGDNNIEEKKGVGLEKEVEMKRRGGQGEEKVKHH
jgi:hypothetical protein